MSKTINNLFLIYIFLLFQLFNYSLSSLKFNIPNNREKCFAEEIFVTGTLLIRYDLKGIDSIKKENQEKVLQNIKLFVKGPDNKMIHEINLSERKGKFAFRVEKEGYYFICSKYYKIWSVADLPKDVLLGIKISHDYSSKNVDEGLKRNDVDNLREQITSLKYKMVPSISSSKKEIDEEDKMAKAMISTSNLYFILTLIQIILIFIIAIYQIFNVKKFLSNKRLI